MNDENAIKEAIDIVKSIRNCDNYFKIASKTIVHPNGSTEKLGGKLTELLYKLKEVK